MIDDATRDLMRHALGLKDGNKIAYRNHFAAGPRDLPAWRALVAQGLAIERKVEFIPEPLFHLTDDGRRMAMNADERSYGYVRFPGAPELTSRFA